MIAEFLLLLRLWPCINPANNNIKCIALLWTVAVGMLAMELNRSNDNADSDDIQLFYLAAMLLGVCILLFSVRLLRGSVLKFRRSKCFLKMEVSSILKTQSLNSDLFWRNCRLAEKRKKKKQGRKSGFG